MDINQQRYEGLLARLQRKAIHTRFCAVHLIRKLESGDLQWCGSGTLVSSVSRIITCEHLFSDDQPNGYLYYQVLQPFSNTLLPINRFEGLAGMDVGIGYPGPASTITYRSKIQGKCAIIPESKGHKSSQPETCINLATGEQVRVLGTLSYPGEQKYLLEYDSCPGESGAGFIRNEKQMLILSETLSTTDEIRRYFSIDTRITNASLATAIDIH